MGMKHEERVVELKTLYEALLARLAKHDPKSLPKNIDIKKIEKAYYSLKGYAFVLKRIR